VSKPIISFVSQLAEHEQLTWLQLLSAKLPNESIKFDKDLTQAEKRQCEIAIVADPAPENLSLYPQLKWVQSLWAGVDSLVTQLTKDNQAPSFALSRLVDPILAQTMSEAVLTWVLYLHRDMPKYLQQQKAAQWQQHSYFLPQGRTVGILGLGKLGKVSAVRLSNNGFNVLGWSQSSKTIEGVQCYSGNDELIAMVKQSHILVCLLPLTETTYQLINRDLIKQLPKGASIINFARGGIIANDDLIKNLDEDHLEHAILDVFEQEPLDKSNPLWSHEKITVLPHISAPTHLESAGEIVANNIRRYRKSNKIPVCINWRKGY